MKVPRLAQLVERETLLSHVIYPALSSHFLWLFKLHYQIKTWKKAQNVLQINTSFHRQTLVVFLKDINKGHLL